MTQGCDFAFSRPSPAALKAAGFSFVLRYYSHYPAKNLTRAEADGYAAAGLLIGTVWEDGALLGLNEATAAGQAAKAEAQACGQPTWAPIYVAADADVLNAGINTVLQSRQAFEAACAPYPAGMYGGYLVCSAAAWVGCKWLWQTVAWSGGKIQSGIGILQNAQSANVGGSIVDVDIDEGVMAEHGLWTPGAPPPPAPTDFGPGWWTRYGFAPPPPDKTSVPIIVQGKVIGEQFV